MKIVLGLCVASGLWLSLAVDSESEVTVGDGFAVAGDRSMLLQQAHEAAGEEMSAMKDLEEAQNRMRRLTAKMARRAVDLKNNGNAAKSEAELKAVRQMNSLSDQVDQHLNSVAQFSNMAEQGASQDQATSFLQRGQVQAHSNLRGRAPEDELAKEMTHDLEMNFNKIAPFGKEDTAKELQDHAAKTQDTLVDAVENAEVAEIKRAVFRALTRLRAATIKEFDTIARLETQAIDAYNDAHHYRAENPLAHLHEDEAPVETDKLKSFH
jgi:hypothetical protein